MGLFHSSGDLIDQWEIPTDTSNDGAQVPAHLAASLSQYMDKHEIAKENVQGLGVGCPGFMDMENGVVHHAVNIGWRDFPLKQKLQDETDLPVIVDNDANVAAIGEMWKGAGNDEADCLCITLGTGVGGGVIVNNDIVHGSSGIAGEIGHVSVVRENGAPCNCGRTGCLETIASATGIVRLALDALQADETPSLLRNRDEVTSQAVFEAATKGDELAQSVVSFMSRELGHALAQIAVVLNPSVIVLGGGVSKAGATLLDPVRKAFEQSALPLVSSACEIKQAVLGNDAGIVGCAWLVREKISGN
ncbi:ROK family glucokinase [Bacillaceae bacterium SIJ1]|nr:ROK family glucokinase [Litoribacterium kuwaitense]